MLMNPFKIGRAYSPESFVDRVDEYCDLLEGVKSGNNVVVIAPRRFGKTWFLQKFSVESGFSCLYVDLFGVYSVRGLVNTLVEQIFEILRRKDLMAFFVNYLKNLPFSIQFNLGFVGVSFSKEVDNEMLLGGLYELLNRVQRELNERLVIVLDEFQAYKNVHKNLAESLRSYIQSAENVGFVFSGSFKHMLEQLFFENSGILYHSCLKVDLNPLLPEDDCVEYLVRQFGRTGKVISPDLAKEVYTKTKGHPYYLQLFGYELWSRTQAEVDFEDVEDAFNNIVEKESYNYDILVETLGYKYVKNALKLVAEQSGELFSSGTLEGYDIPNSSALSKVLRKLSEYGIVEKLGRGRYEIVDPVFEEYARKRFSN
ncbi:ATP-binding protein [Fervidobacterium pennivorans subsp. keratinolyticus]|nr:ATP-binding protein [Fervidobacterium pennivorans subsp. keratinolyticus]